MAGSSRFIIAVHVLSLLAHEGRPLSSDLIAGSVNTNPVSVRRILGRLTKAGIVSSTEGAGGGSVLARPAAKVTLADVYQAVEPTSELFGSPRSEPNPACQVGRCVQDIVRRHTRSFELTLNREMRRHTLADILADVRKSSA